MIGTRHKCNAHNMHAITVHLHWVAILRSCDEEFCNSHKNAFTTAYNSNQLH